MGNNANSLVESMVNNNIRMKGEVIFEEMEAGVAIAKAMAMSPADVIRTVKNSRLRGRSGTGFPTGMKWALVNKTPGDRKVIICNANEGEPGAFKDRVILTERANLMFEGMTIAGYAMGAETGILYLRAEYTYLRHFLENILNGRRDKNLLGENVCQNREFNFDIRIQMGAGLLYLQRGDGPS